jgi:hypothetical protein
MSEETRFKINLLKGEIEFEGSESFIEKQLTELPYLMELMNRLSAGYTYETTESGTLSADKSIANEKIGVRGNGIPGTGDSAFQDQFSSGELQYHTIDVPVDFSDWLGKFKELSQTGSILISGYFVQKHSSRNAFMTSEANRLLKKNGIKLANAAASLNYLRKKKYVRTIKKAGKLTTYRVSDAGVELIARLMK